MTLDELNKLVDHEIQWLYYYSTTESKNNLNENSEIYRDLKPMNYSKRIMKLDLRCCPCTITSDKEITSNTDISELKTDDYVRSENKLSPVEAFIKLYPDKKMLLLNRLKTTNNSTIHYGYIKPNKKY
jgi:hypothetical protein